MSVIALAGKGGTSKTTVAGLLVRYLVRRRRGTVLAIDADPSSNLNLVLGLPLTITVGDIRERMLAGAQSGSIGTGITRHDFLNTEIRLAVEEGDHVDLLAMGRPEGQGCYCPVNHMLRQIIDGLGRSYDFVVTDKLNIELAGMIPADPRVGEYDAVGRPLVDLGADSPAAQAIEALAEKLLCIPVLSEAPSPDRAVSNQNY